jgi:membrane protein
MPAGVASTSASDVRFRNMKVISYFKEILHEFFKHQAPQVAAATSYFTIFSLPVILVCVIWLGGQLLGAETAQAILFRHLRPLLGGPTLQQVQTMINSVRAWGTGGAFSVVLAVVGFTYGLAGAFLQLQRALNAAWDVRPDPKKSGILRFVAKRLIYVLLVMAVAFLMLVFFVASAILSSFRRFLGTLLPLEATTRILRGGDWLVSVVVFLLLLAAMFKFLPDARVGWRDVWLGAGITAVLFNLGKYLIALVVSRLSPVGLFGAAGSVVILMIWIYISMMILLLGAEIISVTARSRGKVIRPDRGAVRVRDGRD